jgi:hypothetical protein
MEISAGFSFLMLKADFLRVIFYGIDLLPSPTIMLLSPSTTLLPWKLIFIKTGFPPLTLVGVQL